MSVTNVVLKEGEHKTLLVVQTPAPALYEWLRTSGDAANGQDYLLTLSYGRDRVFVDDDGGFENPPPPMALTLWSQQDHQAESTETVSFEIITTFGTRLIRDQINITILDQSTRDEYLAAALEKASLSFNPATQPHQLLARSYVNLAADFLGSVNDPGGFNGEAHEAQQYLLGVLGGTDWARLGGLPLVSFDFEILRYAADHFERAWLVKNPDLGDTAPDGVLDLLQGYIEGTNGNWRQHLPNGPAPMNTGSLPVVLRSAEVFHQLPVFRENYLDFSGSPDVPAGPVALLVDKLGGAYALSAGDEALLASAPVTVALGGGNDFGVATAAGSRLNGGDGHDILVLGHSGGTLSGGLGADLLVAGEGGSFLRGDEGADQIIGGAGFDNVNGNRDNDTIDGGSGGGDWLVGGQGADSITAHAGNGILLGNMGDDSLAGGAGNETLRGGQGHDIVDGGAGDDWISGDLGDDRLTGGAGADTFFNFANAGRDRILDFDATQGDRVRLEAGTSYSVAQAGSGTVISFVGGGQLTLDGVTLGNLPSDWIGVG